MIKTIDVPTGKIGIMNGKYGKVEFLSIGDYGKEQNIKADFLGLSREIDGVPNGKVQPLSEKWVITISTQYGCSMGCKFCDVPKVGKGLNATYRDMATQIQKALQMFPVTATKRLNIHFARMGEPTLNNDVLFVARDLKAIVRPFVGRSLVHPVVSTMMPRYNFNLLSFLQDWCYHKNDTFRGCAGLQLSINSTDDKQRDDMFNANQLPLREVAQMCRELPEPVGRKYALNFALADGYIIDAKKLAGLFDTERFMVKITPMHRTNACKESGIDTTAGYEQYTPYKEKEEALKKVGFDVLVFIPSKDEDESRITCGNAILSDTEGVL